MGRSTEIGLVMEALGRRTRNNPVLVGEPGVGRCTTVEGLAYLIVADEVPIPLRTTEIYILDPTTLLADSPPDRHLIYESLNEALDEIRGRRDILLVIEKLHELIGTASEEGASDPLSLLKKRLARGDIQTIWLTTADEYRNYLERDVGLEGRFEPIQIAEPSATVTIEILKSVRDRYEATHSVTITDQALVAAAFLTRRYVSDRYLPAKAIDAIDTAGSRVAVRNLATLPAELRGLDDEISLVRNRKFAAVEAGHYDLARTLADAERAKVELRLTRADELRGQGIDFSNVVDEDIVREVVAGWIGVPIPESAGMPLVPSGWRGPEDETIVEDRRPYALLNDQPVGDRDDDLMNSSDIAASLASMLIPSRTASPFVLAIDGGWGMGKSTLLRQIESQLPVDGAIVKVRFNAWTAARASALEGLIKTVLVQLDANLLRRWSGRLKQRRTLVNVVRLGSTLGARLLGASRFVDQLWDELAVDARTRNQLRELIQDVLGEWVRRDRRRVVIVFIDDLDRCSDDVVLQVCEALKLYLDAPGLIFVVACDLSLVAHEVSGAARGKEIDGRIYLEKIVQVAYRLAPPTEQQTELLIQGYAQLSGTSDLVDATVAEILVQRAGRNPRRIKRIINSLVLEDQLNPGWRNPLLGGSQLVRAILLQHLYSEFYALLVNAEARDDPMGDLIDYAEVRARASDPPPRSSAYWSVAARLFQKHNLPIPDRSADTAERLLAELETLEQRLPPCFFELARDRAFVELILGVGDAEAQHAFRVQLVSRPLAPQPGYAFEPPPVELMDR